MKRANKNFRREMLAAEQERAAGVKRYPLNYDAGGGVTIYSSDNIRISCSSNLLIPKEIAAISNIF